ncbi:hypothetical protein NGA_0444300, partial [Nannochloropsis gaditana CCMP526]|uniref:uncharacterized protein n=1 Tax=Nannochloropsis gaditana (strain CCMP526) TaxID=1093141 RepID=UPI00029F78A5
MSCREGRQPRRRLLRRKDKFAALPLQAMKTGDLRKSLFLSAKVLNLTRALDTFQVTWQVYEELRNHFEEDENTAVVLIRALADEGRLEEATRKAL